jgi:hypothetical protein
LPEVLGQRVAQQVLQLLLVLVLVLELALSPSWFVLVTGTMLGQAWRCDF